MHGIWYVRTCKVLTGDRKFPQKDCIKHAQPLQERLTHLAFSTIQPMQIGENIRTVG